MMAKIFILLSIAVLSTALITEGFYQFEDGEVVYIKPLTVEQKAQVLGCDLECANNCFATKTGEEAIACEKDCGCIDILGGSNQLKFWKIPFFGNVDMDDQDDKKEEEDEEGEEEEENEEEEEENEEEEEKESEEEEEGEGEGEGEEENGIEEINKQNDQENQNSEQEEERESPLEVDSGSSENQTQEEETVDEITETNQESSDSNSEGDTNASEETTQDSNSQEEAQESQVAKEDSASESIQETEGALPEEIQVESSNPDTVNAEELTPSTEEQPIEENEQAKEELPNEFTTDVQPAQESSQTLINIDSSLIELSSCNKECLGFCSKMEDNDTNCVSQCMSNLCSQNSPKINTPSSQDFWSVSLTFLVSICIIYFIYRKLYPSKTMRRRRNHDAFYQSASDYVQI